MRQTLFQFMLVIIAAWFGYIIFDFLGIPAAALTGATSAVTVVALLGFDVRFPAKLRNATILLLGINIGTAVSPEALQAIMKWPISLSIMSLCVLLGIALNVGVLKHTFGYDRETAILASAPGHLTFVLGIAQENNRDVSAIAIIQSIRVLFLTLCVPPVLTYLFGASEGTVLPEEILTLPSIILTLIAAVPVAFLFDRLKFPAHWLLAGMTISALGHGSGISPGRLPDFLSITAFLLMGALIGSRFSNTPPRKLLTYVLPGLTVTLVTVSVALIGVLFAMWAAGLPFAILVIAYSPGAIEAMAAITISLGFEPVLIAAHHVTRLALLSVAMPLLLRR